MSLVILMHLNSLFDFLPLKLIWNADQQVLKFFNLELLTIFLRLASRLIMRICMLICFSQNYCCQSGRIGADEEIDDTKGKTMEEIEEMIEERELKAGTQILEMVS